MTSLACCYPPQLGVKMGQLIAEALQVRKQLEQVTENTHMQFSAVNPMWKFMPVQFMDISEDGRQVVPHDVAVWDDMEPGDKSPFVVDGGGAPCGLDKDEHFQWDLQSGHRHTLLECHGIRKHIDGRAD